MTRWFFLVGTLLVLASATYFLLVRPDGDGVRAVAVVPDPTATQTATPVPTATSTPRPASTSTPSPTETPNPGVDIARLVVPSLEIDAPIIVMGVDESGTMEVPDNPTDVAWYTFSGRPGSGKNVVLAGHLDYVNYGPAVFYRIKDATPGDEIRLELVDGTTAYYRVLNVTSYQEATAPVEDIVGPTENEIVTLITCGGSFDPNSREYDQRVVVRAERVSTQAAISD